jgi:hypothetical protein
MKCETSGAEARCYEALNRRHKCLLHPVLDTSFGSRAGIGYGSAGQIFGIDVILPEHVSVELPDAVWRRTKCRGPSTQPRIPFAFAQGRSVFGRDDRG